MSEKLLWIVLKLLMLLKRVNKKKKKEFNLKELFIDKKKIIKKDLLVKNQ